VKHVWLKVVIGWGLLLGLLLALVLLGMGRPPRRPVQTLPPPSPLKFPLTHLPAIRGFCIQLDNPSGYTTYRAALKKLHQIGCRWINIVINARQHNIKSDRIAFSTSATLSPPKIRALLLGAHQLGIHTMLMPIVLLDHAKGDQWRGEIAPRNWALWFASYRRYIVTVAGWARRCHVAIFSVGSELISTEPFTSQWERIISAVRRVYHGKLTYSANWDHYAYVGFWNKLDYIGMNSYYDLARRNQPPVQNVMARWTPIKAKIMRFSQAIGKPVLITEVGWDNLINTLRKPWDYVGAGRIDPQVQLTAYQAFVRAWRNLPAKYFAGAFIWEWYPGSKPTDYGTYSLQGEPALNLVEHWISGR
jgi:hypothetical protein